MVRIVHRDDAGCISVIRGRPRFRGAQQDIRYALLLFVFEIAEAYKSEGRLIVLKTRGGLLTASSWRNEFNVLAILRHQRGGDIH
jgi:hypothetical protein